MAQEPVNEVRLRGRLSGEVAPRELPSGDTVVTMRVVVPRAPRPGARRQVDTIDVACGSAATRRVAARLTPDDHVEVEGTLHRRFFRAGGAAASRYEVEALRLRRLRE